MERERESCYYCVRKFLERSGIKTRHFFLCSQTLGITIWKGHSRHCPPVRQEDPLPSWLLLLQSGAQSERGLSHCTCSARGLAISGLYQVLSRSVQMVFDPNVESSWSSWCKNILVTGILSILFEGKQSSPR